MLIHIEIVSEKTIPLKVNPSITVHELKTLVEALEGIEHGNQRLQLDGKVLLDFFSLEEADFSDGCKVILTRKNGVPRCGKFFFQPSKLASPAIPAINFNRPTTSYALTKPFPAPPTPLFLAPTTSSQSSSKPKTDGKSLFNLSKPVTMTPSGIFGCSVPTVQPSPFSSKSDSKVVSFPLSEDKNQAGDGFRFSLKNNSKPELDQAGCALERLQTAAGVSYRIKKMAAKAKKNQPMMGEWSDDDYVENYEYPPVPRTQPPSKSNPQVVSFPLLEDQKEASGGFKFSLKSNSQPSGDQAEGASNRLQNGFFANRIKELAANAKKTQPEVGEWSDDDYIEEYESPSANSDLEFSENQYSRFSKYFE